MITKTTVSGISPETWSLNSLFIFYDRIKCEHLDLDIKNLMRLSIFVSIYRLRITLSVDRM